MADFTEQPKDVQDAERKNMPRQTSPPLTLTKDQLDTLFPDTVQEGQQVTITLTAGAGDENGNQNFTIDDVDTSSASPDLPPADDGADVDSDPSETAMLGYDRGALLKSKKKSAAPKFSAADLQND